MTYSIVKNGFTYIQLFPDFAKWLIENTTHDVVVVFEHHKKKSKIKITKEKS